MALSLSDARRGAFHLPATDRLGGRALGRAQMALTGPTSPASEMPSCFPKTVSQENVTYEHYAIFPSELQAVFEKK